MINVSREFQKLMNERTDFKENAEITFSDGTVLNLTEKDFTVSNNNLTDASETNGIPLGVAVCRSIQIELMNDDDKFSEYDFFGAIIRLYLTFQLSETVERIEYGTFTVLTPETYGTTVIITALDDMYKADKEYQTNLVFPATIGSMLSDACTTLGISQGTTTFLNDDFVVNEKPTDITYRQLFGYISMLAGGNARVDRTGRLQILTYDFENMESIYNSVLNGGSYNPWNNPVNLDGGSFSPWNDGDAADGGEFGDRNHFHVLGNWSNFKVDTDDVVITGVQTTYTDAENEEHIVMYGVDGYVLSIENPLIVGKEQNAVDLIGNVMVGGRFRQFSGDLVANPTIEFMDIALILDRKGNMYFSFVTDINFQFFGFTSIKNSAESTLRNSAKPYSEATKTLVKARKLIAEERTAREQAVAQLAKDLKNSSGLFMTEEEQKDGSVIYYMHDKPTLAESMIVWKLTALAFGISTDGGKTYPYGFTVNGELITRLLYAEGIDADYIDTGAIRITDTNGNTMFLADYDTKEVQINADKVLIGSQTVKNYVDSISNDLQSQIDGNIETYTGTNIPTLSNYPANTWTTTALKDKHIGDFYYVSGSNSTQGFAYRFQKNGTTYSWVLMKDSEVTKALQDAADAMAKANSVGQDLTLNYSTTEEMNSAITETANEIKLSVSETYSTKVELTTAKDEAISTASNDATTKANSALQSANNNTEELLKYYSTTEQMNSAITAKANEITLSVSQTYETKATVTEKFDSAVEAGQTAASQAESNAKADTVEKLKSYSTTEEMNSAITAKADAISLSVSKTYETITESGRKYDELSGKITVNANAITAEVKRAQGQEVELAAAIAINADNISLKVTKGNISSEISQESGKISIKSNRFSLESTNCTITEAGKITAKDVDLTGKITANSGKIGGFNITDSSIYYKHNSLGTIGGVYIGTNGISVGNSFKVDYDGNIKLGLDTDIEVGGVIKFNNSAWNGVKYNGYTIFTINSSSHAMNVAQDIIIGSGKNLELSTGNIIMGGATSYIRGSSATNYKIKFETSRTTIADTYSVLGKSGGQIGFFGNDGAAKKTVSTITSTTSATASTCATKINELINALKEYNLIG